MKPIINDNKETELELDAIDAHNLAQKKKKRIAIIGASTIIAIIVGGFALFNTGAVDSVRDFSFGDDKKVGSSVNKDKSNIGAEIEDSNTPVGLPVNVPDWGHMEYSNHDKGYLRNEMLVRYSNTNLLTHSAPLSSEANGYHIGGEMDDYQVSLTREEFISTTGEYVERLINPTLGGWSASQYSNGNANEEFPINKFNDMFSDSFLERNKDKPFGDYVPVLADWNSDNYGMDNLSHIARWYGDVQGIEVYSPDINSGRAAIKVEADIKFSSWTDSGEKTHKDGILTLFIVETGDAGRTLVIDDAQLNVT